MIDEDEYIDYIMVQGVKLTPASVRTRINNARERDFDLDLIATPIVRESERVRKASELTEEQREALDYSPYELSHGVAGEKRFGNEFDYYAALIRASEDNADRVFKLKRRAYQISNLIASMYRSEYDNAIIKVGRKNMGANDAERDAWFHERYPALYEINEMYSDFLDEIDIELQRWQEFSKAASRMLSATELSYRSSGRLFDRRSGRYEV